MVRLLVLAALALAVVGDGVARAGTPAVPILQYHVIGTRPTGSPLQGLYVTPKAFAQQVDWLAANGWTTLTLAEVADAWRHGRPLARRSVVISFDDGYPGDWRYALPVLRAHGFVGVLNLQIGNLLPGHVRRLIDAGWEVDSHTFTHPDLRSVSDAQLEREVVHSRRWLQRVFHVPVPAFCYPFGFYDARVVAAVRRAGYLIGETENQGWASPRDGLLTLDRLRITPTTGVDGLASLLRG